MDRAEASELVQCLFAGWYPTLVRYALRATGRMESAEDIVQETFLLLYKALRQGQHIDNPKGWTLCVVRRQIGKQRRSVEREFDRVYPLDVLESIPARRWEPVSVEAGRDEATRLLGVLSPREGEVVLLRMQAMKYREIATQLGISPATVNTLLARALRKLQQATSSTGKKVTNAVEEAISKAL